MSFWCVESVRRRQVPTRVAAATAVVLALVMPDGGAGPAFGQDQTTEEKRDDVRQRRGEVALEVDALEAERDELTAALATLADNVTSQAAELEEAERAANAADADVADAERAVRAGERRIVSLEAATDELMVDAYINPPTESMFTVFTSENITDAALKQALLDLRTTTDADLFDQLAAAREDLDLERGLRERIADEAEDKRDLAEEALAELEAALEQQEQFTEAAEQALEDKLAEAANLAERDKELSDKIAAEQAELARQIEAARKAEEERRRQEAAAAAVPAPAAPSPPAAPVTVTPAPGGLARVNCPGGGDITVAGSLAPSLGSLLDAAGASGVGLCGWGYRDPERQVDLRRRHCGGSTYAVWHMPASQCSPPTARPGKSMHEQGLAVDFTCDGGSIGTRSNRCFGWLAANAGSYGLYNLPSEPWHWSTTGR